MVFKVLFSNDNIKYEEYFLNGKYHRIDGPANIHWLNNGQKDIEEYYINGRLHREDGPSIIWYHNGRKLHELYYLNGVNYFKVEWIEKLKEIKSSHYKEQKMLYDMEKYNL